MTVNIQKLFDEDLPARLAKNSESAKQIGGKFQFNITGEGGGEWFIDVSDSGPKCYRGNPGQSNLTLTMASADFQKLYENPQANGMALFFAGKMKITGDNMLVMKLPKLFTLG